MSRTLHIKAKEADILKTCARQGREITAIETLTSGGTRVVLKSGADAEALAKTYSSRLLRGPVQRRPIRPRTG